MKAPGPLDGVDEIQGPVVSQGVLESLAREGFVVLPGLLGRTEVERLRTDLLAVLDGVELGEDSFAGPATRRHHHPFSVTRALDALAIHPVVSSVLDHTLGPIRQFGMTVVTSIEGAQRPQGLHYDAGVYPLGAADHEVMVNTIWALDDFTIANGATRVVLGSHRWPRARRPSPGEAVAIEMALGSVLIYSGRLWHGSGEHHGQGRRLGVILEYIDARLRPAENHTLSVPPGLVATLPEVLRQLLGYNQPSSYFGFVAGMSPEQWLQLHHRA